MTNIKVKSQAILKNHTRFGIAKEFPTIRDFARLCSLLDASTHLYKRVCLSVGWSIGWSVGLSFFQIAEI